MRVHSNHNLDKAVEKLYQLSLYARWLFVLICWLTLGIYGLWGLRFEYSLWQQHLTWASVRYALAYNLAPSFALAFCVGITSGVLVWHGKTRIFGLSSRQKYYLEQKVKKIMTTGSTHPLHYWISQSSKR